MPQDNKNHIQPPWETVGLTEQEYDLIRKHLQRKPNELELGLYGLMWSEHCSYKSSLEHLAKFPTEGEQVLQGPGENAGAVKLGEDEDTAVVFRIESHNHPSAVEPVQGAATGVGGILRDVFTMGARPVALFDSLRFGDLDDSRVRYLFEGVVSGISFYGNCVGVPTIGGEIYFESAYQENPLVNVMCLGFAPTERLIRGKASGVGNSVFVVGARTGRDGIHGASLLASQEFDEEAEDKRPAVQVGDPFREKLLIEACLQMMESDAVVGINDLGAAGLTSAAAETASRAGNGIDIDVSRVPRREQGMTPYEVMLSESQERMLVIVEEGRESEVSKIFSKWELEAACIGTVTDDGFLRVSEAEKVLAEIPVESLTDGAPTYNRKSVIVEDDQREKMQPVSVPDDFNDVVLKMISHPNLASRRPVYSQYDHMVGVNTVVNPGADAAVLRVKGSEKGVAATVDGNGMLCHLNPRRGAKNIIAEGFRNLAAVGAEPLGITNCLNFASPEKPEVMGSFVEVVEGMTEACEEFDIPVTGGNVSFYNETAGRQIYPTPTVGMVGVLERVHRHAEPGFCSPGDLIVLLGCSRGHLGATQYLKIIHDQIAGPVPEVDFSAERSVAEVTREAISCGWLNSAHDVSDGGLATALVECCTASSEKLGAYVVLSDSQREDALLFGEEGARMVVSLPPERLTFLLDLADEMNCPYTILGMVAGDSLKIDKGDAVDRTSDLPIGAASAAWRESFSSIEQTSKNVIDISVKQLMKAREEVLK